MWHVSNPIGCQTTSNSSASNSSYSCSDLSLSAIECNLPLCPFPNDTLTSGLDTIATNSTLLTANSSMKAGTQIQFKCSAPRKCTIEMVVFLWSVLIQLLTFESLVTNLFCYFCRTKKSKGVSRRGRETAAMQKLKGAQIAKILNCVNDVIYGYFYLWNTGLETTLASPQPLQKCP